ncbi:DUF397 domain-containing protein [Streptomyces griseocarneus]|uniref:DUF397 domain-containing protein n=1 Tax=Streptomyces griseocarneus TaxID=51201 RepID=UPI00167C4EE3|nr:DUF397 domain-containing protein [Streptomyces griseocarneus]MBZ6477356.1 DUF397 domain-containing protein [Streptomyces griseocarneus]GHG76004.1 hypothetical protein GCM10018779_53920 [Streptomyces griseocarneus]
MGASIGWQKSSFSGPDDNPDCLELAAAAHSILIRESDEPRTILTAPAAGVRALLRSVKRGALGT